MAHNRSISGLFRGPMRGPRISFGSLSGYAAAKLVPGLLTFLTIPVWIRLYGVAEYGRYSVLWAVSTVTGAFCVGWIRQSVLRGTGDVRWSVTAIPLRIHMLAALFSALPVLAYAGISRPNTDVPAYIIAACSLGFTSSVYAIAQAQIQRVGRAGLYAIVDTVRVALTLAVTVVVPLYRNAGAVAMLGSSAVTYVIATVVFYMQIKRSSKRTFGKKSMPGSLGDMWRFGWPLSLWLAVSGGVLYVDRLFIAAYLGHQVLGEYSAIADLVNRGLPMLAFPITMAVHPMVMKLWNSGARQSAVDVVTRATGYLMSIFFVVGLSVYLAAPEVFTYLLPQVPLDRYVLGFLLLGSALWQIALLVHKPLEFGRRTGLMLVIALFSAAITVGIDAILVPNLGPAAAAFALAAGAAMYCIVCVIVNRYAFTEMRPEKAVGASRHTRAASRGRL